MDEKYCGQQETESGYGYVCTLRGEHEEHRAMDTQGNVIRTWPVRKGPAPQSGSTPCACRDCMDVTVSSDVENPDLCAQCKEAGCEAYIARPDLGTGQYECQRSDAYEG